MTLSALAADGTPFDWLSRNEPPSHAKPLQTPVGSNRLALSTCGRMEPWWGRDANPVRLTSRGYLGLLEEDSMESGDVG
ncbi:MAG: hypothetical protein IPO41_03855 [Acidobacteria bacterium]|nr:hypothetical protein [Acidobacteriota bacterium]